ncbi:MAG: tRNA dihydrouridine synthase DusB [bacterium]
MQGAETSCMLEDEVVNSLALVFCDLDISGRAVLAPMAGVTDSAFRRIAKSEGAALVTTELVSSDGLVRNSFKSFSLLEFLPEERPIGIQLFGSDPAVMAEAVRRVEKFRPDFIDLNFGCPVKKVVRTGAGAALLRDLPRMEAIARAAVSATSIPISAKIRSGWSAFQVVAVEASRMLEESGIRAICIHPRTQKMGFQGCADWAIIGRIKASVSVPVIGNGDIRTPEDGKRMLEETGCDAVMIGRGALGRPWIFRQTNHYLKTSENLDDPSYRECIEICLRHYRLALQSSGESRGVVEMRKHVGWYLRGMPGSSRIRREIFSMEESQDVIACLRRYAEAMS